MKTIDAAVYETHGNPAEVLRVESRPWPAPAAGEVIVKMRAAPINPADLNQIEGKYPVRASLPATPGFEGAGIVAEVNHDVTNVAVDALVILPHNAGTWRDAVTVKADELVVVPAGIEPVQAAMLKNQSDDGVAFAARLCRPYTRRLADSERREFGCRARGHSNRTRTRLQNRECRAALGINRRTASGRRRCCPGR